ncbi:unnamed protein product [Phytomonas sp. Hart1]|nr:unnamed protein product [Phytomonas sp. Hart1]|eukprot:CCW68017.1 unnamed protein product [Phytomonas sp. isolate Hart1]
MPTSWQTPCPHSDSPQPLNASDEAYSTTPTVAVEISEGDGQGAPSEAPPLPDGLPHGERYDAESGDAKTEIVEETMDQTLAQSSGPASVDVAVGELGRNPMRVRWCVHIALQSFHEEPWAINLRRIARSESCSSPHHEREWRGKKATLTNESSDGPPSSSSPSTPTLNSEEDFSDASDFCGGEGAGKLGNHDDHPAGVFLGPKTTSQLRGRSVNDPTGASHSGIQLRAVRWSEEEVMGALRTTECDPTPISRDALNNELRTLQRCLGEVNHPPLTFANDELLRHIYNVEFILSQGVQEGHGGGKGKQLSYTLRKPINKLLYGTLGPAVDAVMDHGVNAIVLMYGGTREMRHLGLIGTPKALGLFPKGITMLMERYLSQDPQPQPQDLPPLSGDPSGIQQAAPDKDAVASSLLSNGGAPRSLCSCEEAAPVDGDRVDYFPPNATATQSIHFVRVKATFIVYDTKTVVDLFDLNNRNAEMVLKVGHPHGGSTIEHSAEDFGCSPDAAPVTNSFVLNAHSIPVETINDAFSLLDVGLENFSHTLQKGLFESETSTTLMFSLTLFTDAEEKGGSATMHMICLAEDQAVQTWLASTLEAHQKALFPSKPLHAAPPPPPPPFCHQAATMLLPAVYFGNVFVSVMVCVYNAITALTRVNRDLGLALMGYRMHTAPTASFLSFSDPAASFSGLARSTLPLARPRWGWGWGMEELRSPTRRARGVIGIPLGEGDKDFLAARHRCYDAAPQVALPAVDISIVVVNPSERLRVVLNPRGAASHLAPANAASPPPTQLISPKKERGFRYTTASRSFLPQPGKDRAVHAASTLRSCGEEADSGNASSRSGSSPSLSSGLPFPSSPGEDPLETSRAPSASGRSKDGEEAKSEAAFPASADPTSTAKVDPQPANSFADTSDVVGISQFYKNAMGEEEEEEGADPARTPAGVSPSVGVCKKAKNEAAAAASRSSEAEDLESLLEEFSVFFRHSYESERRLKELEKALETAQGERLAAAEVQSDPQPGLIDPRALLEHMEARLESVGPPALLESLKGPLMESAAWRGALKASLERPGNGESVLARATGLDGHTAILKLWDAMIQHYEEVEQGPWPEGRAESERMLTAFAMNHQRLLMKWIREYEKRICALETENGRLRELHGEKGDVLLNKNTMDDDPLSGPPSLLQIEESSSPSLVPFSSSEILAQHKAMFDAFIYKEYRI